MYPPMAEKYYPPIAEKIIKLEKACGKYIHNKIFDPKSLPENIPDEVGIQKVTKTLAESIGMHGFQFIVSFTKLKDATGQIFLNIDRDKNVFIEIQRDKIKTAQQLYAILAHELAHQYLHTHYIEESDNLENERLTDVCAVYIGFGKLLLNGYFFEEKRLLSLGKELLPTKEDTSPLKNWRSYIGRFAKCAKFHPKNT
tara:strand:+ start:260 stop:853 length:594 start_codon:yes stop_codon:yes gene_type:complete